MQHSIVSAKIKIDTSDPKISCKLFQNTQFVKLTPLFNLKASRVVSYGVSSWPIRISAFFIRTRASWTSDLLSNLFAPGTITIWFSPFSATDIWAIPVVEFAALWLYVTFTPHSFKCSLYFLPHWSSPNCKETIKRWLVSDVPEWAKNFYSRGYRYLYLKDKRNVICKVLALQIMWALPPNFAAATHWLAPFPP